MNRVILAALAAAAIVSPAFGSRAPAAQASGLCDLGIFSPFCGQDAAPIPAPFHCRIANIDVSSTANGNVNSYAYDLLCNRSTPAIHITSNYNFDSKTAEESLTTSTNAISVNWSCPHDPWIAPTAPVCSRGKVVSSTASGVPGIPNLDLGEQTSPFSTEYLDDQSRQALFTAQLQNAANHPPVPAPVHVIEDPNIKDHDCAFCTVLGKTPAPAPTNADLAAVSITGPTTRQVGLSGTYTVTIKNQGGTAAPVELVILFAGKLDQTGQIVPGAGLACEVKSGDPGINTAVRCTGGTLAPGETATVVVQARGQSAGTGTLVATLNPSRTVTESTYDNNLTQLSVTVN